MSSLHQASRYKSGPKVSSVRDTMLDIPRMISDAINDRVNVPVFNSKIILF